MSFILTRLKEDQVSPWLHYPSLCIHSLGLLASTFLVALQIFPSLQRVYASIPFWGSPLASRPWRFRERERRLERLRLEQPWLLEERLTKLTGKKKGGPNNEHHQMVTIKKQQTWYFSSWLSVPRLTNQKCRLCRVLRFQKGGQLEKSSIQCTNFLPSPFPWTTFWTFRRRKKKWSKSCGDYREMRSELPRNPKLCGLFWRI